jgi:hypothetical protein
MCKLKLLGGLALAVGVAVALAVALAGCGSSGKPGATSGSPAHSGALALASCMRAHGVPNFPDPVAGGGGVNLDGTGIDPQAPAFKSAQETCGGLGGKGGPGRIQATESQFIAALTFSKCMRTHGYPGFPDPTHVDAPPGPILVVGPGLFFRVSQNFDPNAPAVQRAVSTCGGQK